MLPIFAAAATAATLFAAPLSAPAAQPTTLAPPNTQIRLVTLNGSGCPADEQSKPVGTRVGENGFRIRFDGVIAWVGPYASPIDFRQNCQASIAVDVPEGWQSAIAGARYAGGADLEAGLTGTQRASYYNQGQSPTTVRTHTFSGPYSSSFDVTDSFSAENAVWSPCGLERNLNVNTELRITGPRSERSSSMVLGPEIDFTFAFRRC